MSSESQVSSDEFRSGRWSNQTPARGADHPICANGTKGIEFRYRFVREKVANGTLQVAHVTSEKQSADDRPSVEHTVQHSNIFLVSSLNFHLT